MITGGYRSVAVEMKDHIVLIEAPQSEMATANIIAEVKKTFPNKPIRYVVNTHNHSDHSGGLRDEVDGTTDTAGWFRRDELDDIRLVEIARFGADLAFARLTPRASERASERPPT